MRPASHSVLIADDFPAFRSFVRSMLLKNGFRSVVEAVDGLDAVQKAEELQPDLVLLDIGMPKLSGLEAAARIRLCAPQAKILFVSLSDPDVMKFVPSDGAGYVCKSDVDRVLPAIEAMLES